MKKTTFIVFLAGILLFSFGKSFAQVKREKNYKGKARKFNSRIDEIEYWVEAAKEGIVPFNQANKDLTPAVYTGSKIHSKSVLYDDSPDVPTYPNNDMTQSENSVFVDPNNDQFVLNSNNSTSWSGGSIGTLFGTSGLTTNDGGLNWGGEAQSTGGNNSGDPAAAIDLNGRMYVGFISSSGGQGVAYSDNQGSTWTAKQVAPGPGGWDILDKNHLWVDNSSSSPYAGNVYSAWTDFGSSSPNYGDIMLSRSTDGGETWETPVNISAGVNSGSHDQGVNIQTGPNGEVYVIWAIYDSWPSDETAIGFAKSTDGGATFSTATRAIENIKGVRNSGAGKGNRAASFPSMAVDISGGSNSGNIYIVWNNIGVPGTNSGTDRDIYLAKSTDNGDTWSEAIRVNQDPEAETNVQYMPWISCDPVTGALSVIFYDDRNVGGAKVETFLAVSMDGAETWEDFKISDFDFTPTGIPGLADDYMGDYLGVTSYNSFVYPVWTDSRDNKFLTYTSPVVLNNLPRPEDLAVELSEETGATSLHWHFEGKGFLHFNVYRDNVLLGTTTDTTYADNLPDYGVYSYMVTAMHDEGESTGSSASIQWGDPKIAVSPEFISATAAVGEHAYDTVYVTNTGELELTYSVSLTTDSKGKGKNFCDASGGGDEYISGVVFGDISNTGTGSDGYGDYTAMSTVVEKGNSYDITVTNGNVWSSDDLGIWIDWNQDEIFQSSENVVCEVDNGGQGTFNFTVPDDAVGGETRMRVRIKYSGSDCGDPCGATTYGEVEDYTVIVQGWLNETPKEGTVLPGETAALYIDMDATDLNEGSYPGDIFIAHNGINAGTIDIPVTFNVGDNVPSVNIYATPNMVCNGGSTQLSAEVVGGSGTNTFSWTSDPAGYTSDEQNPVFDNITEKTTFTVIVNDGVYTVFDTTSVYVIPGLVMPEAPAGADTVCHANQDVLYETEAVENATSYDWVIEPSEAGTITGNGTIGSVDFNVEYVGDAVIKVAAVNDCETTGYASFDIYVNICDGVEENEMPAVSMDIFPNPNKGQFTLNLSALEATDASVEILNMLGETVYSVDNVHIGMNVTTRDIHLEQFKSGIYFIHVSTATGDYNKKFLMMK